MNDMVVHMKLTHPPGTINQNNVMLSKNAYEKALDEILKNTGNRIPVTCFSDYGRKDINLHEVTIDTLIGHVYSKDDVSQEIATVHLSENMIKNNLHMDGKEFVKSIERDKLELMLRWIGKPSPSLAGYTNVSDIRIISFDIGNPRKIT